MFTIMKFSFNTATGVEIGLEKTEYTVSDTNDNQVICADIQSGSAAGRDIEIRYVVTDSGM